MNMLTLFPLGCAHLFVAIVTALTIPQPVSALDPNAPGELALSVFVAESPDFIKDWVTTPSSYGPTIRRVRSLPFNQQAHAGFIVTGYTQRDDLSVKFVVDVEVIDPKGQTMFVRKDWARCEDKVSTPRSFILADPVLDLLIEPNDPAGRYQIKGTVRDLVAEKSAVGSWEIEVGP